MAKKEPGTQPVKGLRVTTKTPARVSCAGHQWAGVSEVPAANYSPAQVAQLRACEALTVEDIELFATV
jgi:hypothetical protein